MAITGALVKKNADQTGANYSAAPNIAWDAEVYDADGSHDNASNNTRITVPSAWNGKYGIFTCTASLSSVTSGTNLSLVYLIKGGSLSFIGFTGVSRELRGNGQATTSDWMQFRSGPVLLATGDIFESQLFCADTSITVESESNFGVEILPATLSVQSKVLAKLNSDLTAVNYSTPTAIPFDGTDVYDTDSIHDPSSNNTKLIIPSSLNNKYVIVGAQVHATGVASNTQNHSIAIRKGGSLTYDGFGGNSQFIGSYSESWIQASTAPIQVATGDEFECLYWCDDTSITITSDVTCFGLRVVG